MMMKAVLAVGFAASAEASGIYWSAGAPTGGFTSSTTFAPAPPPPPMTTSAVPFRAETLAPSGPMMPTETETGPSFPTWAAVLIAIVLAALVAGVAAYLMMGKKPKKPRTRSLEPAEGNSRKVTVDKAPPAPPAPPPAPLPAVTSVAAAPVTRTIQQPMVQTIAQPMTTAMPVQQVPVMQQVVQEVPVMQQVVQATPVQVVQAAPVEVMQASTVVPVAASTVVPVATSSVVGQACQQCGNIFMEDSNFCRKCGAHRPGRGFGP